MSIWPYDNLKTTIVSVWLFVFLILQFSDWKKTGVLKTLTSIIFLESCVNPNQAFLLISWESFKKILRLPYLKGIIITILQEFYKVRSTDFTLNFNPFMPSHPLGGWKYWPTFNQQYLEHGKCKWYYEEQFVARNTLKLNKLLKSSISFLMIPRLIDLVLVVL